MRKENIEPNAQTIYDSKSKKRYIKGNFLGKGGFAKCYEVVDPDTNKVYACKIVSKSQLLKQHQKDKMASEIKIHKSMDHPNIVKFHSYFEDKLNVYIILELCAKRTLLELHKRRKCLTDPEVRYYLHQIVLACKYMHDNFVIHRDLKLGNLFLDDNLHIKVGDFGLAARIEFVGERKKTLCGTPNYIAPEILNKTGHSLEVDIWSLGCILYTLQAGDPPFETSNVKDTYNRIKRSDYVIPSRVPKPAQMLIVKLLQSDPKKRPSITEVLDDPYFVVGYLPTSLPLSSLTVAPRFPNAVQTSHLLPPDRAVQDKGSVDKKQRDEQVVPSVQVAEKSHALRVCDTEMTSFDDGAESKIEEPKDCYLGIISDMIAKCLSKNPHKYPKIVEGEAEDPGSAPFYWITKWIDYSERYGLGYQLSDRSFGVLFNDHTRLISTEDKGTVAYIDENGAEIYMTLEQYPPSLKKKMVLLTFFYNYMKQNLLTAGSDIQQKKTDEMIRLPTLRMWRRDSTLIIFLLSCGILQANFFEDHCKLIICPHLSSVTFIDQQRQSHTYKFSLIEKYGCSSYFYSRLKTVYSSVKSLMQALEPQEPRN
ncbi:Serine/threonine-protein kinase PLK1 [Thelohanellus kitauei]|uniref:Serine/threonine-protein kinase PLK n=1 Tax=Thelohanellus kitauei TaxID=669202 RepID=A0A0C2ME41_THEKT|nr:Serine/threonine-protein kinase PLK1 [Thelohanellus kitauei]